jgi:hypothetical protein
VAFQADLSLTSGGAKVGEGIYFFNGRDLIEVARIGNSFLGSTIFDLNFNSMSHLEGDEQDGLNESGQLGYRFVLADSRSGIAICFRHSTARWN